MSDAVAVFIVLAVLYLITIALENKGRQFSKDRNWVPKMVTSPNTGTSESVVPMGFIFYKEDGGGRTYRMELNNSMDNFDNGTIFSFTLRKENTA
mgnify:FL=1|jgi:hypothetical protein